MLQNVQAGHGILFVCIEKFRAEELLKELFKVHVDELTAPLAAAAGGQELLTEEPFIRVTSQLMYCDIDGSATTIKNHDYAVLDHQGLHLLLTVFSTLNAGALGLQTQQ